MSLLIKSAAEGIGTFMLIFTINSAEGNPFAVGGMIFCAMIFTCFVSAALFNPSVTLACTIKKALTKTLTASDLINYSVFTIIQFGSGILASYSSQKLTDSTFYYDFDNDYPVYKAFFTEMIVTCILCINCLQVGTTKYGLYLELLVICTTVITGALTIGHLTKNCLNPVVGVSLNFIYYQKHGKHFKHLWIYCLSPPLGGALAAFISYYWKGFKVEENLYRSSLIFPKMVELEEAS